MAAVKPHQQMGDIIAAFEGLGCEVHHTVRYLSSEGPDPEPKPRRFLINPQNGRMVAITSFARSDWVSPYIYEGWERVLGVDLPPLPPPRLTL